MRVGLVSFAWSPEHAGGLRSHVQDLARSLVALGDEVFVHCVNTDPEAPLFATRSWREGPVHVQEMNYAYQDLQCLMGLQRVHQAEVILRAWVQQNQLDLVDVQHTLFFGLRVLPVLAVQVPTLAALHDYWPLDPHAQLFADPGQAECFSPELWALKVEAAWPFAFRKSLDAVSYYAPTSPKAGDHARCLMEAWMAYGRHCLESCRRLVTPSRASAAVFERYGIGQPITVVENGIDAPALRHGIAAEPSHTGPRGPRVQLGLLGNIAPAKGQLAFCKACLQPDLAAIVQVHLHGHCPEAVQGDPEPQRQIRTLWRDHPHLFRWHGSYERADLAAIFAAVDLLVMPSLWEEVYGLIAREALCYGLPLIVTNAGALAELEGRSHVFILNREDPAGWSDVLLEGFHTGPLYRWVYERRQRRPPLDAEVRSSVECADAMRSLYQQVLDEPT